ncbi:MAG: UBP-type zinc finger domain-containing protein [Candidatus Binatia bacterium]
MTCAHVNEVEPVPPHTDGCEECLILGTPWVHLRLCLSCGHVGCCDSSPQRHATKHFHKTTHPVIASYEPGEDWAWCYVDQVAMEAPEEVRPYLRH